MSTDRLFALGAESTLPSGWSIPRLEDVASFPSGKTRVPGDAPDGPSLTFKGLRMLGSKDFGPRVSATHAAANGMTLLRPGDTIGTNQGHASGWILRKVGYIEEQEAPAYSASTLQVFRPDQRAVEPRFLFHYLAWPRTYQGVRRMAGPRNSFTASMFRGIPVPLPPLAEQRRIAAILDAADALRAARRATITALDTLTQSIFTDMFGDPWGMHLRWPQTHLGQILDFLTSGSRGWAKYYAEEGDLFLRIQNVGGGELSLIDVAHVLPPETAEGRRTEVKEGDVLLSITADLGRTAVIPSGIGRAFINQHLAILRTSELESDFLAHFLESPAGRRHLLRLNREGVKAGLNFDDIRSLPIPLPPRSLQRRFSGAVCHARLQKESASVSLAKLDALFTSLQARAFRGES